MQPSVLSFVVTLNNILKMLLFQSQLISYTRNWIGGNSQHNVNTMNSSVPNKGRKSALAQLHTR